MPRHARLEPDLSAFEQVMASAVLAYGIDAAYAVAMCKKANVILTKKATWRSRLILRDAEAAARSACESGPAFACGATAPCGTTTSCRYSTGTTRELVVTPAPLGPMRGGKLVERPQVGADGYPTSYTLEAAVLPLRDLLEGSTQPA